MITTALYIIITAQTAITEATQTTHTKQENKTPIKLDNLVPKQEILEEALINYHHKVCQAIIQEFNYQERENILNHLPSVSYNFIKLAPSITYNLNKLTNSINKQRAKKARIESIKRHTQIALQGALEKLNKHYANIKAEINLYNQAARIYRLKKELFKLKKQQYQNLEITPTEFIQSQIKIKTEKLKLNKHYTSIIKLRNRILELAKANYAHERIP